MERDNLYVDARLGKIVQDIGLQVMRLDLARRKLGFAILVLAVG
jgi:hypothetical protein